MRVSGEGSGAREPERRAAGFDDALARARGADERLARARGAEDGVLARAREGGVERRSGGVAPLAAHAPGPVGRGDHDRVASAAPAGAGAEPARADHAPDPPAGAELAAVARALPPAIAAARVADGPLALSFGRSLDVELRSTPAGIELLLRPEAGLARAADAELPRVVAALRLQGVAVARAEVRPRPGGGRAR